MDAADIQGHQIDENEVNRRTELITNAAEKYLNGEVAESDNAAAGPTVDSVMTQQLLTTTPLDMGLQMHNISAAPCGVAQDKKKRDSHNEIERRRKCKINIGIIKLGDIIPICLTTKMSKNQILEQACLYIDELRQKSEKLLLSNTSDAEAVEEIKSLRKENEKLRSENKRYQEIIQDMESQPNGMSDQPKGSSRTSRSKSGSSSKVASVQNKPLITYLPGGPNQVTVAVQGVNQMQNQLVGGGPPTLVGNVQGTSGGMAILQPNPNGAGYILVPAVSKYTSTSIANQSSVVVSMSSNQNAAPGGMVIANQVPASSGRVGSNDVCGAGSQTQTTTDPSKDHAASQSNAQLTTSVSDTSTSQNTMVTQAVNTPISTPGNQSTVVLQGNTVQAPGQVQTVRYIVPLVQGAGQPGTSQTGNQTIMLTLPVRQGQNVPVRIAPSSAAPVTRSSQPMILPQPATGGTSVNAQILQGVDTTPKSKKKSSSKTKSISESETEQSGSGSPLVSQGQQQMNVATPPPGGMSVRLPVAGATTEQGNIMVNSQGQQIMVQQKPGQGSTQNVVMPMQISRPVVTQNLVYIQQNGQLIPVLLQQNNATGASSGTQAVMQPIHQQPTGQNFMASGQGGSRVLQTNASGQIIMSTPGFQTAVSAQQSTVTNHSGVGFTHHQDSPGQELTDTKPETQDQKDPSIMAPLNVLTSGQNSSDRNQEAMTDYSNDRDNDILAKAAESIFSPNSMSESSPMMNFSDMSGSGSDIKPNIAAQHGLGAGGIVTLQSGIQLGQDLPGMFSTPIPASSSDDVMDTSSRRHDKHKSKKKKKKKNKEKDKDKDKERKKHHHHHHSKNAKSVDDGPPMTKSEVAVEASPIEQANIIAESLFQSWMEKPDNADEKLLKEAEAQGSTSLTSNYSTEALIAGNTGDLSTAPATSSESTPTNSGNPFTSFPSFTFGSDILSSSMSVSGLPTYIEEESEFQKSDSELNSLKALTTLRDSISSLSGVQPAPTSHGVEPLPSLTPEQAVAPCTSNQPSITNPTCDVPVATSAQNFMLDSPTVSQASVTTSEGSAPGFVSPIPSLFSINSSVVESNIPKPESRTTTPVTSEGDQDPITTQTAHQSSWISHHSKASELARGQQPARTQNQPSTPSTSASVSLSISDASMTQQGTSGLFSPIWPSPSSHLNIKPTSAPQTPIQESPPLSFARDISDAGSFPGPDAMQNIADHTSSGMPPDQPAMLDLSKTAVPKPDSLRGFPHASTSATQMSQVERPSILDVAPAVSNMGNLESPQSSSGMPWNPSNVDRGHSDSPNMENRTPEFQNSAKIEHQPASELQGPSQGIFHSTLDQERGQSSIMKLEINEEMTVDSPGLQSLKSLAESTEKSREESLSPVPTSVTSSSGRPVEGFTGKKSQPGKTFSIKNLHRTLTSEITELPKKPASPPAVVEPPEKSKPAEKTIPPLKIKIPKSKRRSSCQKEPPEREQDSGDASKGNKAASGSDLDQIGKRELNPNLIDKYPWLAEEDEDGDRGQFSAEDSSQSREKHSFSVHNISQSSQRSGRKDSGLVMTFQRRDSKHASKDKPRRSTESTPPPNVTSSQSTTQGHSLWNPSNNEAYNRSNTAKPESANMYSSHSNDVLPVNRGTSNLTSSSPSMQYSPQVDTQTPDISHFSVPTNRDQNSVVPGMEKSKTRRQGRRGSNSSSHSLRSSSEPECSPMQPSISEHSSPTGFHDIQGPSLTPEGHQSQNNIKNPRQSPVVSLSHQQQQHPHHHHHQQPQQQQQQQQQHQQQQQNQQAANVHDPKRYSYPQNQSQMFQHHDDSRSKTNRPPNSFQNFLQSSRGTDFLGQSTDPTDPIDFNLNMFDSQKEGTSESGVISSSSDSRQDDARTMSGRQGHSQPAYISQNEMVQVTNHSHNVHHKGAVYTQSEADNSAQFGVSQSQPVHIQQHSQAIKRMANTPTQSNPPKRPNLQPNHHGVPNMQVHDQRQANMSLDLHHSVPAADMRTSSQQMHQSMVSSSHVNTMRRGAQSERTLTSVAQSQRQSFETSQSGSRCSEGSSKGRKRGQNSEQFFHGLGQGQNVDNSLRHRDHATQDQTNWPGFPSQRTPDSSEPFLPLFSSSGMTQSQNAPASTTNTSIVSSLSPSTSRRLRGNELPTYLPHLSGPILPSPAQSNKPHQTRTDSDISAPFNAMFGPGRPASIPMNVGPNFPVFTEHQTPHSFNVSKTAQISGGVNVPPPFNFNLFNDQHSQASHCNDPPLGLPGMHLHGNPPLPMEDGMASLRGNVGTRHPQSFGNNMRLDSLLSQSANPDSRTFKVGMPMGPHFHSTFGPPF